MIRRPAGDPEPRGWFVGTLMSMVAVVFVAALALLVAAGNVAAQPTDDTPSGDTPSTDVRIAVQSVSPWVTADGEWTAALAVTGAPADAQIGYSIRQPPTGTEVDVRDALAASRAGEDEPKVMRSPVVDDLAALTDPDGVTTVRIPVRAGRSGDRDRILLLNSGSYPVVVSVTAADGTALARQTLHLNRLPVVDEDAESGEEGGAKPPFRLGIIVQPERLGGFDDQGEANVTPALRATINRATEALAAGDGLPLQLALSPESLVALTESDLAGDAQLVERLVEALGTASVTRTPWADLHLEGWATSGAINDVQTSLIDGQQALFARLQRQADPRLWPVDPTVGPTGVGLLTRLGISSLVVEPGQLVEAKPPTGESGFTRPFRISGPDDAAVTGIALDPVLQELLVDSDNGPGLASHQMITAMVASWIADDRERGTVIRLGDDADPEIVAALLDQLSTSVDDDAPIAVVDPVDVFALAPAATRVSGRDVPWTRQLIDAPATPTVAGISRRLATARPLVDDYASIVPAGDPEARRNSIIVQRSLDRRITPGAQEELLDAAIADMDTDLDRVSASEPRSLTVTSRRASIPLRFTNDLQRPIRVRLRLQSPRLDFVDGEEQTLTLSPGLNRLDVAVEVRASGQFVMQADLLAPDSDRVLASTRQRVRSTTFSGVGLMLSGGALLFLVIWWSRTLRRRDGPLTSAEPDQPDEPDGSDAAAPTADPRTEGAPVAPS